MRIPKLYRYAAAAIAVISWGLNAASQTVATPPSIHWTNVPRLEFKATAAQRTIVNDAAASKGGSVTVALSPEQAKALKAMYGVDLTQMEIRLLKVPPEGFKIYLSASQSIEFQEFYYTECPSSQGKPACVTYRHAVQVMKGSNGTIPDDSVLKAQKLEPVLSLSQRKAIDQTLKEHKGEIQINLSSDQTQSFQKASVGSGASSVKLELMPVEPFSVRIGTLGCHIKDWETWCDSVGCHMLCKPECD